MCQLSFSALCARTTDPSANEVSQVQLVAPPLATKSAMIQKNQMHDTVQSILSFDDHINLAWDATRRLWWIKPLTECDAHRTDICGFVQL